MKKLFEDLGWLVIRSAGSHIIDLIAVRDGKVFLVECKVNRITKRDEERLRALSEKFKIPAIMIIKKSHRKGRGRGVG